jgi:hypothetical protein
VEEKLKMVEDKREAFVRLAERRTNAVLERVRVLGNLSNPYAYEYTDDDVKRIFSAIEQELKATRLKFQSPKKRQFKLNLDQQ